MEIIFGIISLIFIPLTLVAIPVTIIKWINTHSLQRGTIEEKTSAARWMFILLLCSVVTDYIAMPYIDSLPPTEETSNE